jgi:hypothetical protein
LASSNIYNLQDNYRIVNFEGAELLTGDAPLKTHLSLTNGLHRPSDNFLRMHFMRCLSVSAFGGNAREDYEEQEIDHFMEDLGIYDGEVDNSDPRWSTPLGMEVHNFLIRDKLAMWGLFFSSLHHLNINHFRYMDEES